VLVTSVENEDLTEAVRLEFLKQLIDIVPKVSDRKALVAAASRRLPDPEKEVFFAEVGGVVGSSVSMQSLSPSYFCHNA